MKKAVREIDKKRLVEAEVLLESGWRKINGGGEGGSGGAGGGGERANKQCTDSKTKRHNYELYTQARYICIWKRSKILIRHRTADMLITCQASYLVTH